MSQKNKANLLIVAGILVLQVLVGLWIFYGMPVNAAESAAIASQKAEDNVTTWSPGEVQGQQIANGVLIDVSPCGIGPNGGQGLKLRFKDGFVLVCWGNGFSTYKLDQRNLVTINEFGMILAISWPGLR